MNYERLNWVFPSTLAGGTESLLLKVRQLARNRFPIRHMASQWRHLQNENQADYLTPKLADNAKIQGEKSEWETLSAKKVPRWLLVTARISCRPSFSPICIESSWMCKIWTELKQCAKVAPLSYQADPSLGLLLIFCNLEENFLLQGMSYNRLCLHARVR